MVFWSNLSKKIKQTISQIAFDLLKNRVDKIETNYVDKTTNNSFRSTEKFQTISMQNKQNKDVLRFVVNTNYSYATIDGGSGSGIYIKNVKDPTNPDNAANKGYVDGLINPLNNKVDSVIQGLQNGNIVNYTGVYSNTKTYNIAEAVTYNNKWYVSNVNNNVNHTPTGSSDQYWELLSEPTINLTPYLTKSEASNTYLLKTMLNTLYPVGSNVMTTNGSTHALVNMFPTKFKELSDNDIAYLAIGTNSSNSNNGTFTINQNNLPNIYWGWYFDWANGITSNETNLQTAKLAGTSYMEINGNYLAYNVKNSAEANQRGARVRVFTQIYLNGNTTQSPITYTIKPKTLKIRIWEVTANLI